MELRKVFGEVHVSSKGDYTRTTVRTWSGLRWTILHVGEYIEMNPGTVHTVLSEENSAVAGWHHMRKQWLEDGFPSLRSFLTLFSISILSILSFLFSSGSNFPACNHVC